MDLTQTIIPKSDQLNADDLMTAPITVTIKEVKKGSLEQPVDVILEEFPGRAYRPSKSMRRVMVMAWGAEASNYAGHRLTLFRNPDIRFGAEKVGGIEISHMSHIDKTLTVALTATRGKRKNFTVEPLTTKPTAPTTDIPDTPGRNWMAELELAGDDLDAVASLGASAAHNHAPAIDIEAIRNRYRELKAATE